MTVLHKAVWLGLNHLTGFRPQICIKYQMPYHLM